MVSWEEDQITQSTLAVNHLQRLSVSIRLSPDPAYESLYMDHPEEIGSLLRRLSASHDENRWRLITSFPWMTASKRHFQALTMGGFVMAVAEMLSDELWYQQLTDLRRLNGSLTLSQVAFVHAIHVFSKLLSFIHSGDQGVVAKQVCDIGLPRFWGQIWRHRRTIFPKPFNVLLGDVISNVQHIMDFHMQFYASVHGMGRSPPVSSYAGHVAIFLWLNYPKRELQRRQRALTWAVYMAPADRSVEHYVRESVTGSVDVAELPEILWDVLTSRKWDLGGMKDALRMTTYIVQLFAAVFAQPRRRNQTILVALAKALQRCLCMEEMDAYPNDGIVNWAMATITALWSEYPKFTDEIFSHLLDLNFLQAVAHVLPYACATVDEASYRISECLVLMLTDFGQNHHRKPGMWPVYAGLRRIIRLYWLPVLAKLRATQSPPRGTLPTFFQGHAVPRDPVKNGIKQWLKLGQTFGLDENSVQSSPAYTDDLDAIIPVSESWKGCSSKQCPCYGRVSLHRLDYICKGCYRAKYCASRCQKLDWLAGHRDVCRGRQV